ncbi:MAG: HNH endonuclease signature motif containing protein [Caldilineaceae bacterium]
MPEPRVNAQQKAEVKQRARACCEYCWSQEAYSPDTFSVEHIIPLAKGGTHEADNLANACQGCNNHKFVSVEAIDPLTGETAALYHPRHQCWSDHFAWNEDYTVMIGLTPTGRATVAKLELNRKGVVNLRRLLHEWGLHPLE